MSESKLPRCASVEKLIEFFDTHDMGEFWEALPEAEFEVDIKKRTFLISVDGTLMKKLPRLAKLKHTSTGAIVNSWLKEKLTQPA